MTRLTAMIIQGNYPDNIFIGSAETDKKYAGFIYLWKNGQIHNMLLSTDPVFDSEDAAKDYMKSLCEEVKGMKL